MSRAHLALSACLLACACATAEVGIDGVPLVDAHYGNTPDATDPWAPDGSQPPGPDGAQSTVDAPPGTYDAAPCVLVPQSGCPGEACDIDPDALDTGGTLCRAVTTQGNEATACTSVSQCGPGYTCLGSADGESCMKFCNGDGDCTGPGGRCFIKVTYDNGANEVPGVTLCSQNCDPLSGSGCPSGWSCHVGHVTTPDMFVTYCDPAGAGGQGAACTSHTDCQPNYACVNDGSSTICLKQCNVTANTGCTSGYTCYGYQTPSIVGGVEYGVCA